MADMNLPSGYGGLMRYNEEYPSRFMIKPATVIAFVVSIILFVIGLKLFFPVN